MVYGGTIRAGSCEGAPQLDLVSAFQSYGKYLADGQTADAEKERYNTVRHACPGPGACGGMYTANTMASAAEAIGMTLPGSSSFPATSQEKRDECASVGSVMHNLLAKNILPRDIMTRSAFENAMVRLLGFSGWHWPQILIGLDNDSRWIDERSPSSHRHGSLGRDQTHA